LQNQFRKNAAPIFLGASAANSWFCSRLQPGGHALCGAGCRATDGEKRPGEILAKKAQVGRFALTTRRLALSFRPRFT
jgi:hypothetical protein